MDTRSKEDVSGELDYTFLIKDPITYDNVTSLLKTQKDLIQLNKRENLKVYFSKKGGYIIFDDRGFDASISITNDINIKGRLAEILKVEIK